jgi:predicted outer membrane repeat protein
MPPSKKIRLISCIVNGDRERSKYPMNKPRACLTLALLGAVFTACNFSTPGATTTYTVGCTTPSLIAAIYQANADPGPAEIILAADCEYKFFGAADTQSIDGVSIRSALPAITSEIEFVGNNAVLSSSISMDSNAAFGFFLVQLDGSLSAEHLTMKNGTRPRGGAVFIDRARAFFFGVEFYANTALGITPAAFAKGGAIYNRGGALSVSGDSLFSLNAAVNDILEAHPDASGGGIFSSDGSLIVNRSTFDGNAAELGGAIAIQESAEAQGGIGVIISGSTFHDNRAEKEGGAILAEGEKTLFSISGSDFTENSAADRAGAIQIRDSVLDLVASSFTGNTAGACGAVENAQGSDLTVSHTDFTGNSTTGSGGGLCHTGRTMEVNGSLFQSNQATAGWGGGIYIEAPLTDIKKSTFSENTAYKGGGLYAGNLPGAENAMFIVVNIRQSTFYANQATGGVIEENPWNPAGGGIGFGGKILIIDQSTIWLNRSNKGAGLYVLKGDVSIMNSTISMNDGFWGAGLYFEALTSLAMDFSTLMDNAADDSSGSIDVSGSAVIQNSIAMDSYAHGGKACKFNGAGPFDVSSANLAYDDSCGFSLKSIYMQVDPLADNGGPTLTHSLYHHSPAVDAGDCHGVAVDQRGESRPKNGACDLGSYELDYIPDPPLPPDSPTPSATPALCEYRVVENANCREGDDARTKLVKILMKGDLVDLLSLNPELTHGLFALPDGRSCWVWMPLMEGPADPGKNCNATIVDPEPYVPEGPACSADLPKAQCEAAGGTMSGASSSASECICPSAASVTDPSTGPRSVACAGTGDRLKDPSASLESLRTKFSILRFGF